MMGKFRILIILSIRVIVVLSSSSTSFSPQDPTVINFAHESCQTEILSGSEFRNYYSVKPFVNAYGDVEIFVRFRGVSDGHIILTENATDKDPLYLVVIGSFDNKLSEIRRSIYGDDVFKMNTPGILSSQQFRGFLIRYNKKTGNLFMFTEGSEMPLLHWEDPDPLYIEYFSFAAYDDIIVQVAFNCKPIDQHSIIPALQREVEVRVEDVENRKGILFLLTGNKGNLDHC